MFRRCSRATTVRMSLRRRDRRRRDRAERVARIHGVRDTERECGARGAHRLDRPVHVVAFHAALSPPHSVDATSPMIIGFVGAIEFTIWLYVVWYRKSKVCQPPSGWPFGFVP